jgi:Tol biopolymer transport system component
LPSLTRRRRGALLASLAATAGALALAPTALATFPGGNGLIAFSRDGDIWTIQPDGTGAKQLTAGAQHEDYDPEWSADGRELLFTRQAEGTVDGNIYRMLADGSGLTWIRPGFSPHPSPDGKQIAFAANAGGHIANRDGSSPREIVGFDQWPAGWSPVNDLILWEADNNFGFFSAVSPHGAEATFVKHVHEDTGTVLSHTSPDWSPDGTRIRA